MKFEITILGSNSAQPTPKRFSSAHIVNFREKLFLFDCGEGTQIQLRRFKQKFSRLNHIFITHLHGDHCFGLPGLLSTFNLMGRRNTLHLYAQPDLEKILIPILDYFLQKASYKIVFHAFDPTQNEKIYEDKTLEIHTIPLKHRSATCGFVIKEKPHELNIRKEAIATFHLSIKDILRIKQGEDFIDQDGKRIPNSRLTLPRKAPRSYAYITDTAYKPSIAQWLQGIDVLYHEATFADEQTLKISKTLHSTAEQAALIAKAAQAKRLIIGHFSSRYKDISPIEKAAQTTFPNTTAAYDGLRITLE